jgi:hypothetical protein
LLKGLQTDKYRGDKALPDVCYGEASGRGKDERIEGSFERDNHFVILNDKRQATIQR